MSSRRTADMSYEDQIAAMEEEIKARRAVIEEKKKLVDQTGRKLSAIGKRLDRAATDYQREYDAALARIGERAARANGVATLAETFEHAKRQARVRSAQTRIEPVEEGAHTETTSGYDETVGGESVG